MSKPDKRRIEYKLGDRVGPGYCDFVRFTDRIHDGERYRTAAVFKCALCNTEFTKIVKYVRSGHSKSCGCLHLKALLDRNITHGMTYHPLFSVWEGLKERCRNENNPAYKNYGGRGIKVCDEWRSDFKAFHDYMSELPNYGEDGYTIDRYPNNDGDYEPGNVRWATYHEQAVNSRNVLKHNGTSSFYVGVFKTKSGYVASISVDGEGVHLGSFNTQEEAVGARNGYIIKHGLWEYPIQAVPDYLIY